MKAIILLHGALGAQSQFDQLEQILKKEFQVFKMDLIGHGERTKDMNYSIETFSNDLEGFIIKNNIQEPTIFGYSMGGYVAMHLANKKPDLISQIITYGTKVNWSKSIAEKEVQMLNPDKIEEKVPKFAQYLASIHGSENWKVVMKQTADLMIGLGENNIIQEIAPSINTPVSIGISTTDEMVTIEESENLANKLPNGKLNIIENQPHPIQRIDSSVLSEIIKKEVLS